MGLFFIGSMALAVISDIRSMAISNRLCLSLVVGFFVGAAVSGLPLGIVALHGVVAIIALLVTLPLFAFGWMGGGDAKFLSAVLLWFGPNTEAIQYLTTSALMGGVLTLVVIAARWLVRPVTGRVWLDRLLSPSVGVPYGVALGLAGIAMVLPWVEHSSFWLAGSFARLSH